MYGQATQQYAAPGGGQGGQFRRPPANNGPMAAQFAPVQPGFNPAMQRPPVGYAPPAAQPYRGPAPPGPQYAPPAQYAGGGYAPPRPTTRQHKGTLPPGQMVRVGQNIVRVERYLSEGGYAHVYLTSSERPIYPPKRNAESKGRWGEQGFTQHCLKRIAFNDDNVWADVSKEIEVMVSFRCVLADDRNPSPPARILSSISTRRITACRTGRTRCSSSWRCAKVGMKMPRLTYRRWHHRSPEQATSGSLEGD